MINKITLNKVASYKNPSILTTDKKINLIYGLNGSGKSTLSNYLANISDLKFNKCLIERLGDDEIYVYNQRFIQENFFEPENLKGIFTLSKANKDAELKITSAEKEVKKIELEKEVKETELQKAKDDIAVKQSAAKNKVWEIKTNYSGGDRVLEFCLEGYKNDGNKLLSHMESLKNPEIKPLKTIDQIKEDVQAISGENSQKFNILPSISFSAHEVEDDSLLKKQIIGNENSTVANLVNRLGNSDWIKEGLQYLSSERNTTNEICPFCQENTISKSLIASIKDYFDEFYEKDLSRLKDFLIKYNLAFSSIPKKIDFESNPKLKFFTTDFEIKYNALLSILNENKKLIESKIKSPSIPVALKSSIKAIEELQITIDSINKATESHNRKIDNKSNAFEEIKKEFWEVMRWEFDQTIATFISDRNSSKKTIDTLLESIIEFHGEIKKQQDLITEQQKQTVNIDEAISSINRGLVELGIEDFKINKHSDILYKIVRSDNDSKIFQTLSEGEKMIISFLYFIEQCRGKKNASEASKKKIIVIDDPISSLSHIYVFNIGRLIHNEFLRTDKYEQVFILTHSLYFFYELTDTNKERRNENQKLFRLQKNSSGSEILEMSYEEIQNDYHSYWYIIKDEQQPAALIANCMRNIIEYFYNFVEKKDLNNVFQKPELQANRFDAFNRYINRESHSLGQNIFDYKEFNYTDFKDAFELVFIKTGYENHYKKMIR